MPSRVIQPPSFEPLSVAEAKDFLRETQTAQDGVIAGLITAVRLYGENYTRRAFCPQIREQTLPSFPVEPHGYYNAGKIELLRPPLQQVLWVKYIDVTGTLVTVDPTQYQVDTYNEPGAIKPTYGYAWQVTRNDFNAVQIRYACGYTWASSPNDFPEAIRQWMKSRITTLYDNRDQFIDFRGTPTTIPRDFIDGLLDPYIINIFGTPEC